MLQSKLFYKTLKQAPQGAETVSHKLLLKAGFIEQIAAGIYNFLPLGYRVFRRIEGIIREEMESIGGQEVFLAALQPKRLWQESDRWNKMDPPLFKLKDRHNKELALGPTHEEVITAMIRGRINSYRDLPFALYQIQTKFRNEMRATGGLLRVREFVMKDLYSFHASSQDLDKYYQIVIGAYQKIFTRCGLEAVISEARSGSIGGSECHEFQLPNKEGEDKILLCEKCGYAVNQETENTAGSCPSCKQRMAIVASIELGHVFKLGSLYSKKMGAYFLTKEGKKNPILAGCYGIGLGRLQAAIIEDQKYHDQKGMIWPDAVAPFDLHLIEVESKEDKVSKLAKKVYNTLMDNHFTVLYDNRNNVSQGEKFVECDLIGIPVRLVVSKKAGNKIEYKRRDSDAIKLYGLEELIRKLRAESKS